MKYYHEQSVKTTNKKRTDIKSWPSEYSIAMLFVASYNELEQLHMQVLLNCHLATFLRLDKSGQMTIYVANTCMCNCSSSL